MGNFFKNLFFNWTFFQLLGLNIVLFIAGQFFPIFVTMANVLLFTLIIMLITDILFLFFNSSNPVIARRITPEKLSNGDENAIKIEIENNYPFRVNFTIIDELPFQFQERNFRIITSLKKGERKGFEYTLRPTKRGDYHFGHLVILASQTINFVTRRFIIPQQQTLAVYPSFIQMRRYEMLAISNKLTQVGIKKIRRRGHQMEFDHTREYVKGDDYRTINWKATARKSELMVNQYQDERSQQVYSLIDMGRTMEMPFNGMSLLDYAINATLVMSNIAVLKHDNAGLITFSNKINAIVPATRKSNTIPNIMEVLYNQDTQFPEPNFELLYATIKRKISQRSLLLLFTNFESMFSMERYKKFLRQLNKNHLLVVIFFKNSIMEDMLAKHPAKTEEIYEKTITEKLIYDKKHIASHLEKNGIAAILTEPGNLTLNTINKYLELKAMGNI